MHTIRCYLTQETRNITLRAGISTVLLDARALPIKGETKPPYAFMAYIPPDTISHKKKNIYVLGMWFSTDFKIFEHFLLQGNGTTS
jgi:hypothetical protein